MITGTATKFYGTRDNLFSPVSGMIVPELG
jgi:hypothetical protein